MNSSSIHCIESIYNVLIPKIPNFFNYSIHELYYISNNSSKNIIRIESKKFSSMSYLLKSTRSKSHEICTINHEINNFQCLNPINIGFNSNQLIFNRSCSFINKFQQFQIKKIHKNLGQTNKNNITSNAENSLNVELNEQSNINFEHKNHDIENNNLLINNNKCSNTIEFLKRSHYDDQIILSFKNYTQEYISNHINYNHISSEKFNKNIVNESISLNDIPKQNITNHQVMHWELGQPNPNIELFSTKFRRRIIRRFISKAPPEYIYWSSNVSKEISIFLKLSIHDVVRSGIIGRVERRFGEPSQNINDNQKRIIKAWIAQHGYDKKPNQFEQLDLMKVLKCSKQQFIDLWKNATQSPGTVDLNSKEKLVLWIHKHNKDPNFLTIEDRNQLQALTGWSRTQLHRQLQIIRQGKNKEITEERKSIIKDWLQRNNNRLPTTEERDQLENKTQLARRQLDNLITHFRQIKTPVSSQSRWIISTWLRNNSNKRPNRKEREILLKETGLASWQLTSLISQDLLSQSAGKIDEGSKDVVRKWFFEKEENKKKRPTPDEKDLLIKKTGWNQKQLSNYLRQLRQKLKKEDQDK